MKNEDLIKKLENLETPDIELPGHKRALKMFLLNSGRFKQKTIRNWAKVLAPIAASVLLIAVGGFFGVIQPQLQMNQAKAIVSSDVHVQELMAKNDLEITEVKVQNGQAYLLLSCQAVFFESGRDEDTLPGPNELSPSGSNISLSAYIIRVDLAQQKATGFSKVGEARALQDIKLEDLEFVQFGPSEGGS